MATTMNPVVGNSISLAERFLPILDEIYERGSATAILDLANTEVRWIGAKTVQLFDFSSNGLGNYSRNEGFVRGDNNGTWDAYELTCDRGRSWVVDTMDNDETLGQQLAALLGETERRHTVPEIDAYRFAKYAMASGLKGTPAAIDANTNMATLIDEAQTAMDEANVPYEGRILFVSPKAYENLKSKISRIVQNRDGDINNTIEMYNDMRVVRVPQTRFNTAITLANPTAHDGDGGYTLTGAPIHFMIIHPSAVMQVVKHAVPRLFSPEQNQEADAWKFNYRLYHDAFVRKNGKNGIYLCCGIPTNALSANKSTSTITGTGTDTVTVSNIQGVITASSSNTAACTVAVGTGDDANKVTITGVAAGSATVTIKDTIGQSVTVTVTVTSGG